MPQQSPNRILWKRLVTVDEEQMRGISLLRHLHKLFP